MMPTCILETGKTVRKRDMEKRPFKTELLYTEETSLETAKMVKDRYNLWSKENAMRDKCKMTKCMVKVFILLQMVEFFREVLRMMKLKRGQ